MSTLDDQVVIIVGHISECDVEELSEPMPRHEALALIRNDQIGHAALDLIDATTGRFTSWCLP